MARRAKLCLVGLVPLVLVVAVCRKQTTGATNVKATSATLHANVWWQAGESGDGWFKYRPVGGTWTATSQNHFNQASCAPNTECGPSDLAKTVTGLSPDTTYEYVACGQATGSTTTKCYDGTGTVGGTNYTRFRTLASGANLLRGFGVVAGG